MDSFLFFELALGGELATWTFTNFELRKDKFLSNYYREWIT